MDIGSVVVYEHVHELRVTFPNSDKYLGLTLGVRSSSSEAVKAMMRKLENQRMLSGRAKQKKVTAEDMVQNELETTAACIASCKWEAGDKDVAGDGLGESATYGGETPDLSKNVAVAMELLDKVSFIYAQVKEASTNLENFMGLGQKG